MTTMPPNGKAPSGAFLIPRLRACTLARKDEAAFEAIISAASHSIRDGHDVRITVPGKAPRESPLGVKSN